MTHQQNDRGERSDRRQPMLSVLPPRFCNAVDMCGGFWTDPGKMCIQRFVSIFSGEKKNRGRSATTVSAARRERMGCMQSIRGREVEEKSSPVSFFLGNILKTQISSVYLFHLEFQKSTHLNKFPFWEEAPKQTRFGASFYMIGLVLSGFYTLAFTSVPYIFLRRGLFTGSRHWRRWLLCTSRRISFWSYFCQEGFCGFSNFICWFIWNIFLFCTFFPTISVHIDNVTPM